MLKRICQVLGKGRTRRRWLLNVSGDLTCGGIVCNVMLMNGVMNGSIDLREKFRKKLYKRLRPLSIFSTSITVGANVSCVFL